MYNSNNVADNIKKLAKSKNVTIKKLLEDVGLGFNTMTNMKTSMPKADNLAKIADYLDCSVDYLLGRTDCPDLIVKDKDGNTAFIEIMRTQNVYKAKIAASDGSFNKEVTLTDSDLEKLSALPDVNDI